jgi:hypothetical protein
MMKIKIYLLFLVIIALVIFYSVSVLAQSQQDMSSMPGMKMDGEMEIAHPFFTHMGMLEGLGTLNLRLAGLAIRDKGKTEGDFAFHLETSLTKYVGLHIRNDRFRHEPNTELMFQFIALKSYDGMSGLSPYIEFEVPTRSGHGNHVYTLVGFSSTLSNSECLLIRRLNINQKRIGWKAAWLLC